MRGGSGLSFSIVDKSLPLGPQTEIVVLGKQSYKQDIITALKNNKGAV